MNYSNKKYLYALIDAYLEKKLDEKTFCDNFYKAFDLGERSSELDQSEELIFDELGFVVGRFSSHEEDLKKMPNFFYNKNQLAAMIHKTKQELMKIHPEYFS